MSDLREQFETVLAEFGTVVGCPLALDGDGTCRIVFNGKTEVRLGYDADEDQVAVSTEVARLDDDAAETGVACRLLAAAGDPAVARGFVLALAAETRMLSLHDRRPASWFYSADRLAEWFQSLLWVVDSVEETLAPKTEMDDFESWKYAIRV